MKKQLLTSIALTSSVVLAGLAGSVAASENPFVANELSTGYQLSAAAEGKCGEGKCGEGMKEGTSTTKTEEGKCGEGKANEGKCGGEGKATEGKCGEGKKTEEGKCGEGKCGSKG